MPYTIRKNKLVFRPNVGNGPACRRRVGEADRRIIVRFVRDGIEHSYHATKGWRRTQVSL